MPSQQAGDVDVELVEHGAPLTVAGCGRPHGRVHDVGEQDGGQQPRRRVRTAGAGDELLQLVEDGVEFTGPRHQVGAGEGHVAGTCDVLGQVAAVLAEVGVGVGPGDHEGRAGDIGQAPPDIGREGHEVERLSRRGTRPASGRSPPPFLEPDAVGQAGGEDGDVAGDATLGQGHVDVGCVAHLVLGHADVVAVRLAHPRRPVDDDERRHPLGMGGGDPQGSHGAAARCDKDGLSDAGAVHHGKGVPSPALDRRVHPRRQRVGQPEAATIEADEPGELGRPFGVAEPVGLVCRLVDGDHEAAAELDHVDHVAAPRPPDLVADVEAVTERVLGQR